MLARSLPWAEWIAGGTRWTGPGGQCSKLPLMPSRMAACGGFD
ncbi:hypothetical protein [Bradyrhizobium acaciae]|nr:hypothetical protein [Bradyrhizobium acaciae]